LQIVCGACGRVCGGGGVVFPVVVRKWLWLAFLGGDSVVVWGGVSAANLSCGGWLLFFFLVVWW
jgi:hypothetical protein